MFKLLMEVFPTSLRENIKKVLLFQLDGDQETVREAIVSNIDITGIRFWFLVSSCVIASIGLNTNSPAVIIGAMLISPLMGPILGIGFSLATRSREILLQSTRNVLAASLASLFFSTLYFMVSPFNDSTSEIMARTSPTLLDLFVAVAAAFAGVIAMTVRTASSSLAGVAIATAIMPPICAAGYGIAQGNWKIAAGAFYLYVVNGVAIALVAFSLFKRMDFHSLESETAEGSRRPLSKAILAFFIIAFITPLTWTLVTLWEESHVRRQVTTLVRQYEEEFEVLTWQFDEATRCVRVITLKEIPPSSRDRFRSRLKSIEPDIVLDLRQTPGANREQQEFLGQLRASPLLSALIEKNGAEIDRFFPDPDARDDQEVLASLSYLEREAEVLFGSVAAPRIFARSLGGEYEVQVVLRSQKTAAQKQEFEERFTRWLGLRLTEFTHRVEYLWQEIEPVTPPWLPFPSTDTP